MNDPPAAHEYSVEPPSYQNTDRGVRHRFPLLDKRGKQWGLLMFRSGARAANSTPLFYENDTIHGSFEMEVEKGDSMRSVTVKVAGSVVTGSRADDTLVFFKLPALLWTRTTSPPEVGRHTWPFSIPLPSDVNISTSGRPSTFRLPESFLERHTRVTVLYEISVAVSRGLFRPANHFKTRVRYVPCTRPDSPSPLRQRAYLLHRALYGPSDDPHGWDTSATAMSHGYVFKTRQAVVQCTLSLARPCSYIRGSVIPCYITFESGDLEALDLFAAPDAIDVQLRRTVQYQPSSAVTLQATGLTHATTAIATAVWWPKPAHDGAHSHTLEGEIRLPADLISSSAMGLFSISYTVELMPPNSVGFTPAEGTGSALLSVPVEIATMYAADAPRPVVYAPPAYDGFTPRAEAEPSEEITYTHAGGLNMR
ncbi:hypothetical protein C8R44DRAFT_680281 [Mycena epipterygia]|nr:hypothetical protein C8R44DRAFT_680281 [Mycena epipterygia]